METHYKKGINMTEGIIDITPHLPKQAATTEQDTWYYPEEETN